MLKHNKSFVFEKRSIFLINFIFVLMVIFSLLYNVSLRYFFYFNILFTMFLSYSYFKKSKELAKSLIVTNLFIFFYFLYPQVAWFVHEIFGVSGYVFVLFYNVLVAYVFILLSGYKNSFFGNFSKFNFKIFLVVLMIGFVFGLLFSIIKEPIPSVFTGYDASSFWEFIGFLAFSSFIIGFSEQMIFSGFLFNSYKNLTSKFEAYFQVALIFVLFHLLRFQVLVSHYFKYFNDWYLLYISAYYVLLFVFMCSALYFYSFKYKKYEGNFAYPVALHFAADFGLFFFYLSVL